MLSWVAQGVLLHPTSQVVVDHGRKNSGTGPFGTTERFNSWCAPTVVRLIRPRPHRGK